VVEYNLESLRSSLSQFDKNIESIELVITRLKDSIKSEEEMLRVLNDPSNPNLLTHAALIEIDSQRIRESINGHYLEISNFEEEIKQEQARKLDTEKLIMRIELKEEMIS